MNYYSDDYTAAQENRLGAIEAAHDAVTSAIKAVKALGNDTPGEFENAEGPMLDLAGDLKICIEQFDDTLREEAQQIAEDKADHIRQMREEAFH